MRPALVCIVLAACGSPAARRVVEKPPALAKVKRSAPPTMYLSGSRLVATADSAFVADEDSGSLLALDGRALAIGRGLGQLVHDPVADRIFVADRRGDRVVVVDAKTFAIAASYPTPAEPFALALTPDRATLLVATIADRTLVALDSATGAEKWHARIAPGARGVAVSPDGTRALVASTATGQIQIVELTGEHRIAEVPYDLHCESCGVGNAFTRGTGAVRYLDDEHVVATFQRSIPDALIDLRTDRYGGSSTPPITQHVAFFTFHESSADETVAQIIDNQPRSLAWDPAHQTLWVMGHGSDSLLTLPKPLTTPLDELEQASSATMVRANNRCGPDGMSLDADGGLLVWCAFTRTVLRLDGPSSPMTTKLTESPPLVATAFSAPEQRGRILFEGTSRMVNADVVLACTTCHVDGATDGLSWRIGKQSLQTPVLAGRLAGTAPYRWDGSAATLDASLASTVHRLGGTGLAPQDSAALIAFLDALPKPRTPTVHDATAVARGKALFEGAAGCTSCHEGSALADGERHEFTSDLAKVDTPSLVGLAVSAPYYHDGSAPTLHDLLHGGGSVHGMSAELAKLDDKELADLEAFLQTL